MRTHGENPWRRLRALGSRWSLRWSDDLPDDTYGHTNHVERTITLRNGLSFEERRSTIAHEIFHVHRGAVSEADTMREELLVDRLAARQLLPCVVDLADCLVWAHGDYEEASRELWVDPLMLEVRLSALDSDERAYLDSRLADVIVRHQ